MIRLRILGSIELADADARELTPVLAQPKRFALLAYLAAADGAFVRRDTLLAMFWPELDDTHARQALNQAVRFLRKSLGDTPVLVSRGGEELAVSSAGSWCDVTAFRRALDAERLTDALELYRDDLLPGFHCGGAAGFNEWLERERQRLREAAARAARTLATRSEHREDYATAVRSARRAVELSSADERAVRELLALLDRIGDRAGAMHAYDEFARRLAEELDATPAAETAALIEAIRVRGGRTARAPTVAEASAQPPPPERTLVSASPPALIVTDSTVAVAPFDVFGAGEHAFWREGLVDVLAANLDRAGPMHAVSSSLAISRWNGRADPASADSFGRALRVRYVVFGRIVGTGRDSLRVSASLYDVAAGTIVESLDLTTAAQRMDRLADSISILLLRALARARAADNR